jgi:uncharacterized protein YndB with AHSA1/START domain
LRYFEAVSQEEDNKGKTMASVVITPDKDTIRGEIFVAAPPERVFEALTDPRQMLQWWGQKGIYRTTKFETDVRPGGKWMSAGVSANGATFEVTGEYIEVDPPRVLVQSWNASWTGKLTTIVRWELEAQPVHGLHPSGPRKAGTGTLVKISHRGFAGDAEAAKNHAEGWQRVLSWVGAFVEKGETIDTRS